MVYIYKKIIGKKPYYYLRASVKKGKKTIVKDLSYLGSSLDDVKKNLNKLPEHKEKIRKAYRTINNFLESNRYLEKARKLKLRKDSFLGEKLLEAEACKLHFTGNFQKQNNLTKKEVYMNFLIEFAFNTTSIEGNTITLEQARNLLENGLTPKGKTLREIYDLQNTERVFFKILDLNKEISHEFISDIHKGLMQNIDNRLGYRKTDVRVFRAKFKSTPAEYVKADMNLLLKWYKKNKDKLHPLVLAALFHHKFEKIHPFMDGNGRTGRILLNYLLIRENYPPLIIRNKFRSKYLDSLDQADKSFIPENSQENYSNLVQFVADEMISSYWNIFLI